MRCAWAVTPLSIRYHDEEWGVPLHDDQRLFEFLILEGAQAGLSWETILRKRQAYRRAFNGFDVARVAAFDERKVEALLTDPGIVRNGQKVRAAVRNARAVLDVQASFGSLDAYLWRFVDGRPIVHSWQLQAEVPAGSAAAAALSADLRRRGFGFVGPTICYAFMQATGMVNDHLVACFRHGQVGAG